MLFDYEKQEDDELNITVGEIVTNVTRVCVSGEPCGMANGALASARRVTRLYHTLYTNTLSRWKMAGVRGPIRTERGGCFLTTLYR